MSILKMGLSGASALALCISPALAQSFNLDVGDPSSVAGVPSAAYGGAANQPGVWNTAGSATAYVTSIVDLSGAMTGITTSITGNLHDFTDTGMPISNPDEAALMHDIQNTSNSPTTWTFNGLADGNYDVYTYAWAPDETALISAVTPAGGTTQNVGGPWPGMQVLGTTYALHAVNVMGGELAIDIVLVEGLGSVNGFQFVLGGSSLNSLCNGDGGDQMGCTDCPCGNNSPQGTIGGCLNSVGRSAHLLSSGSTSVSSADLRFVTLRAPRGISAILTSGSALAPTNMTDPCFGLSSGITSVQLDGLRCAVQGVLRHGVRVSDDNGNIGITNNGWGSPSAFLNFDAFVSGETRYFQVFYRDDAGAGCMTGQNTSEAVRVPFTP